MQSRLIQSVIRHAEQSAYREQYRNQSDAELFRAFHADKDHCAFAGLVRRHGPMVWSVCQNLLRSEANAEDAFQATFLALVRAKGSIRNAAALGGWLHRVAVQVCQRAQRDTSRRLKRESAAAVPEAVKPNPDREWRELHERVHREIDQLPDKQRTAFVLCCLEGVRPVDAAKQLGMKVNTLTSLLTRARQQMLGRLKESGQIAGLLTGVAVLVGSPNSFAVPSSLMDKVFLFAQSDVTTGVSSIVLNLAHAATEVPMVRFKLLAAMLLVGTALSAGVGGTILSRSYADDPFAQSKVPQDVLKANPRQEAKQAQEELLLLKENAKIANALAQAHEQVLLENNKAVAANVWDYKVVTLTNPQNELTKLGNDGWELVTIDRNPTDTLPGNSPIAYLKRKKEPKAITASVQFVPANNNKTNVTSTITDPATAKQAKIQMLGTTLKESEAKNESANSIVSVFPLRNSEAASNVVILKELFGKEQGFKEVVADTRTNSLVLYGSVEMLEKIQELLKSLDQQKSTESKGAVLPPKSQIK